MCLNTYTVFSTIVTSICTLHALRKFSLGQSPYSLPGGEMLMFITTLALCNFPELDLSTFLNVGNRNSKLPRGAVASFLFLCLSP
jgi:hypothetical protein